VSEENKPQGDFVTNVLAGIHMKAQFNEKTRGSSRYEAAFRRFTDFDPNNRQDHLLSLLFRRRLRDNISILALGNLGLRYQPNDRINNYYKQSIATQASVRWLPSWSSQFGMQFRYKSYPHNSLSNYSSAMLEGNLGRRVGNRSQIRGGYQFRTYNGAVDPRVLQLEPGEEMEGFRQTASLWFESIISAKVLMELGYQMELDIATEDLQRPIDFLQKDGRTGEFEDYDDDFDGEEDEDMDFNFLNHKAIAMLAWALSSRSTVALYARYDAKFYSDWPVPMTNKQRHDNLILLRIYLKHKLFSGLSARLQYSLEKNNSNDPTQKYTDNIYSMGLRFVF
jgi:hypothetical protein